jgi:hypothetical protein
MPSTLHCVLLFGKYRLLLALADENSVQTALKQAKKAIDRRDAIRERPPGFKSFEEKLTSGSNAIMCPACRRGA